MGVEVHEKARKPMYKLTLDLGPEIGQRIVVAGIRDAYSEGELMGKHIICLANLEPKEIAGVQSHGMILAAEDENAVAVLVPDRDIKVGSRIL